MHSVPETPISYTSPFPTSPFRSTFPYYQKSLGEEGAPVIDGFTGIQRVFLGYGQVWRNKYRDEALRLMIGNNPHAPAMYRANGAVRNVPEFCEAFEVTENDELFLAPEERVKIW